MGMNNDSVRPNNRPKSTNNKGIRANYRPMRAFFEHMRENNGLILYYKHMSCNNKGIFDHLALHTIPVSFLKVGR